VSQRKKAEALLVTITFIWGSTFVIVKGALADASPLAFLAVRFVLAGLLLFVVLGRWRRLSRGAILPGVILGLFLFAGYLCQTYGLLYTTPSKSAFITGSSVILVPLILTLRGVRMRSANFAGALLGAAGLYFLVLPSGFADVNLGDVLTLVGACSFAVHIVLVSVYTRRHAFQDLVPVQVLAVGVLALVALPAGGNLRFHWTLGLAAAIVVTAVFATGFAFSVQNWAQQYTPPAHTALIFALEPVFAALTSLLALGERLGKEALLGSALVLVGMIVSELWGVAGPSPVEG
jgi:drug/metabolite transporter (DMT)-like permease